MDYSCITAIRALENDVALAGIMAKEHTLDLIELMVTKQRFILLQQLNKYVVRKERYL